MSGNPWIERVYHCYVILGSPSAEPAWHWNQWRRIAAALDPLVKAARGPAGTSSTQKFTDRKSYVPFRRMGWGDKAHQKWTHASPTNANQAKWRFQSTEVWAPTPGVCKAEGKPPDVFFGMSNEGFVRDEPLKFNPVLFLAVASDLSPEIAESSAGAARRIGEIVGARLLAQTVRPWAKDLGDRLMTDVLNDALYVGLFRVGPRHDSDPQLTILAGDWRSM